MSLFHPSAEWHALQDTFYRKHRIYQMQWSELDLSKYRVASSSFGGPIALLRDDRQLLEAGPGPLLDSAIRVYSASGKLLGKIEYEGLRISAFSWNSREQLICVQEDGNVRVFSLNESQNQQISFSLGPEAKERGVVDVKFWDQGLVAMLGDYRFLYINDIGEPKPRLLANAQIAEMPRSWTIVPPHLTLSHHIEVLVSAGNTILTIDAVGVQDQLLEQGPYSGISVSPNGRLVALCTETNCVQVVSIDFQRSYSEHTHELAADYALDMAWCGSDAVLVSFPSQALLVGPFGDTLCFAHDTPVHLVQEPDGVRMFNAQEHSFVSRVGAESKSVFQIGSTSPAALLYDALENMRTHSARADEIVRSIGDDMSAAVDACISAAGVEPIVEYQQSLLRAASLGKSFLAVYNGDKLVDMCRNLRILNTLASYDVGIPATLMQLQSQPFENWIQRLLNRNKHKLALAICQYMEEPVDQIYIHWACAKIRASNTLDDDSLYRLIRARLEHLRPGISSYVEISEVANACGYQRLAIRLLQHEPRAANQVPLLISMGQEETAMASAIRSGDADLVYFVIFHLFKTLPLSEFFQTIGRSFVAGRLFEKYALSLSSPVLSDYYFQEDAFAKSARLIVTDNLGQKDVGKHVANLKVALKILHNDKAAVTEARALDSQIRLLQTQHGLEQDIPGHEFVGLPLNQTLAQVLVLGNYSRANKIRTEFKVPERRYYWIKLHALVQRRDWVELARLANAKKSPIGYRPFVDECIQALQYQEAAKYITRIDDLSERAHLYLKIGFYHEAAYAASQAKNVDLLRQIHAAAREPTLQHDISQMIEQMTSR
ncbi:Vacuolar protein [Coemansia sp. RSA 2599]|nr:Vacuolar protein [Coemansia sp. RSA 2598]KAJ1828812.1 Vacuolar protein [Coemansia sp. RSA 2599]